MNKENIQTDTDKKINENDEKKENLQQPNRFSTNINSMFKLPIQYNNTIATTTSLLTDLELLETKNASIDPIYNILFNPKTELGRNCIK